MSEDKSEERNDGEEESSAELPKWVTDPEFIHSFSRKIEYDVDVGGDCDSNCHVYIGESEGVEDVDIHEYAHQGIPKRYDDGGRTLTAHRVSYMVHKREPIPTGLDVHHHCNIKRCVRIDGEEDHLEAVTRRKNAEYAVADGRNYVPGLTGEDHGQSKLTADFVRILHYQYHTTDVSQQKLANRYGLARSYLAAILRGEFWKHIYDEFPDKMRKQTELTASDVRNIFEDRFKHELSYRELAEKYSISNSTVSQIINRRTWKHVDISDLDCVPNRLKNPQG